MRTEARSPITQSLGCKSNDDCWPGVMPECGFVCSSCPCINGWCYCLSAHHSSEQEKEPEH